MVRKIVNGVYIEIELNCIKIHVRKVNSGIKTDFIDSAFIEKDNDRWLRTKKKGEPILRFTFFVDLLLTAAAGRV